MSACARRRAWCCCRTRPCSTRRSGPRPSGRAEPPGRPPQSAPRPGRTNDSSRCGGIVPRLRGKRSTRTNLGRTERPGKGGAAMTVIDGPLTESDTTVTGEALQGALVDLLDLSLVAKQAHWNLYGPRFRSIHLQLDEVVATARTYADTVAERAAALGV